MSNVIVTVEVRDPIGFHARPVGQVVSAVKASGWDVVIRRAGEEGVVANSPLKLLSMKVKTGEVLEIVVPAEGSEAEALAHSISETINQEAP
ncbi:MAG: HPr family phosphocarrier protein [Pontimonas sp.]